MKGEWAAVVLVVLLALAGTLAGEARGPFLPGERLAHDLAQRHLAPLAPPPPPVAVVLVDDESLARLGERWPLDRATWARFLEAVTPLQPRAVLLDAWFESPARREAADLALDLADALRDGPLGERPEAGNLADSLEKRAVSLDADRRLATALGAGPPTVLGLACLPPAADAAAAEPSGPLAPLSIPPPAGALRCASLTGSHASLAGAASGQAALSVAPDDDGVIRTYPYVITHGDATYASLGLEGARLAEPAASERRVLEASIAQEGRPGLFFADLGRLPALRFSDVLEASAESLRPALAGRVVFVGVSAQGTRDLVRTPLGAEVPGVFAHAAASAALLEGRFLFARTADARRAAWLGLALLALVALATLRTESLPLVLGATAFTAALVVGAWALAFRAGLHVALVPALGGFAALAVVRIGFALPRAAQARRQARAIRHAFQHYLAPAVVEALVRDPQRLRLGGERRRITAFFSDIQGFTGLSERLAPAELVDLLNLVLGRMTEALIAEGGTVDKYIGDAIVGLFGAPLDQPDHPERACRAALRCQRVLAQLQPQLAARGLPPLVVRIGLNTGEALVGNMGSAARFDYTMIGDAVNLAARLEGINGQYGTRILVGEATARACGPDLVFRELDAVRPKGKSIPVRIFELVGEAETLEPAARARLDRFARGLESYRARRFDEALSCFEPLAEAGDGPAQVFVERSRAHMDQAPPAEWDAVHTLTSK